MAKCKKILQLIHSSFCRRKKEIQIGKKSHLNIKRRLSKLIKQKVSFN